MAQQVRHTETSTMIKATKVADYIVERICRGGYQPLLWRRWRLRVSNM